MANSRALTTKSRVMPFLAKENKFRNRCAFASNLTKGYWRLPIGKVKFVARYPHAATTILADKFISI